MSLISFPTNIVSVGTGGLIGGRGLIGILGGSGDSISYDLAASFNIANQTFTNAQVLDTAAEGVQSGSLTVVDSGAGTVKVVSNELELVGTGNIDETGVFGSTATTKALGKALFLTYTPSNVSERGYFGFVNTAGMDIVNNSESILYHRDSGEVRAVTLPQPLL